jgi:hypothetical protein
MTVTLDAQLQDCMYGFEDKMPIHCPEVDVIKLNSWTWRAI